MGVIQATAVAVEATLLEAAVLLEVGVLLLQVTVLLLQMEVLFPKATVSFMQVAVLLLQVAVIHLAVEAIHRKVAVTPCRQRSQVAVGLVVHLYRRPKRDMMFALRQTSLISQGLPPNRRRSHHITQSSDTLSDVVSEKYVTAPMGSTEFLTAVVQSSQALITSFESFPTIPGSDSEYATANSGSSTDYHTALEPPKLSRWFSPESEYITADTSLTELGDIPSEVSTPSLSTFAFTFTFVTTSAYINTICILTIIAGPNSIGKLC
jgi:hypothetical protein